MTPGKIGELLKKMGNPQCFEENPQENLENLRKTIEIDNNVPIKKNVERRIGSRKGIQFVADGHDLDEHNDEIAALFFDT